MVVLEENGGENLPDLQKKASKFVSSPSLESSVVGIDRSYSCLAHLNRYSDPQHPDCLPCN